jgi:uncharacterized protein (DUF1697 family)
MAKTPTVYLLLFRGVGGATQLPVARLRTALTAAGFERAGTYINSGNALVRSPLARDQVLAIVTQLCAEQFQFTKAIFAPTRAEWAKLIANNPFPQAVATPKFLHAALLAEKPPADALARLKTFAQPGEDIALVGKVAYLHTPHGFGTSKLAEKFDKGIGVTNTARNWNTVLKLQQLADEMAT